MCTLLLASSHMHPSLSGPSSAHNAETDSDRHQQTQTDELWIPPVQADSAEADRKLVMSGGLFWLEKVRQMKEKWKPA